MASETFDVVIIGAGLSGIGAACHLKKNLPNKRYIILESRDAMGGTWDLFRYPGVRSDSDMHTLGYAFKPWIQKKSIAEGSDILAYIREAASDFDVDSNIRYGQTVTEASWDSTTARWTLTLTSADGSENSMQCQFVYSCTGYYRYDAGYLPDYPGSDRYKGLLVHPQHWPSDLDVTGKRVVVIGSGATAITLVPSLAKTAREVTMLQRSPTYIISSSAIDSVAEMLRSWLPPNLAYQLTRWKNWATHSLLYSISRRYPDFMKRKLLHWVRLQTNSEVDLAKHFTPKYNPWDQRLCLAPNGDFFRALRKRQATLVTDHIRSFSETGIQLESGEHLEADVVVSATGLQMLALGGIRFSVDGQSTPIPETLGYRGMMLSGLPNMAVALGYTNASWTLKCDLTSEHVCRLLSYMDRHNFTHCIAINHHKDMKTSPLLDFSSGYISRSIDEFPKQGDRAPWRLRQNYLFDTLSFRFSRLKDSALAFYSGTSRDTALHK